MTERSLLLRHATLARRSADKSQATKADVLVRGNRIDAIEPAGTIPATAADEAIDASRLLVLPGMINGHVHSWDHFLKGHLENLPMELFMAQIRPKVPIALTERQIYLRTTIGAIESMKTGATTLVDDLSLGQVFSRGLVDAALQAYDDSGTRAFVGFSMIDKAVVESWPFVDELFAPDLLAELRKLPRPSGDNLLDLCRDLAAKRSRMTSRVSTMIAPSAPHRCTDAFLVRCRQLADELDLPAMTHVQETRMQLVTAQAFYGKSLVAYLDDLGFLKPRTALVHGTWLSEDDIALIAASGASVQYNPWGNMMTGAGVAPVRRLLEAGINVSMGSDGTGIPFTVSMLNNVGAGAAVSKIREPDYRRWLSATECFHAATVGGAVALGMGRELGAVETGKRADLVCYSLDTPALTPCNDPIRQIVYAERGAGVHTVIVDGDVVVRNGRCTRFDEVALLREAQDAHAELRERIDASLEAAPPMIAALAGIYFKTLECPVCADMHPATITGNNIAAGR